MEIAHDNRGSVEFDEAVLSINLPNFFHDAIISLNTAKIQDFIFENYYEDAYVYELGIDSDDPEFKIFFFDSGRRQLFFNYFLSYLKKEKQRITNRNKYLNASS